MSLKEIASKVGVSVSTVSRVLNNKTSSCASKELKDKIWAAARELGYEPNIAARSLRTKGGLSQAAKHVSIILARISSLETDPFFYEIFRKLEEDLFKQNIVIDEVIYVDKSLSKKPVKNDGLIILGRCSETLLTKLRDFNKNIVGIWRNPVNYQVDQVVCDGRLAA
ncbi:MAG: LacI family transcriptional regulator, partial [Eubacterium sp.]|nr:LacI family transcriptional regulator [Eubacterium sp.]